MKRKLVMLATAMMFLALAAPVGADFITYTEYASGSVSSSGLTSIFLNITPFDTSLGTLNSVTMSAEVNVSGWASLSSSTDPSATLSVNFTNTLDALPEMGWGPTVANYTDSATVLDLGYEYSVVLTDSGNIYVLNTISGGFGRFAGASPFQIGLQLFGGAEGTGEFDYLALSYDGNANLIIDYEYTPGTSAAVPEPATMLLFGFGLVGLAGLRRFKK